jgi:hypothetical protein
MQTLYKDEAVTIAPNLDGYLLSDFQYTLGDLSDGFWLERCATLYRGIVLCITAQLAGDWPLWVINGLSAMSASRLLCPR